MFRKNASEILGMNRRIGLLRERYKKISTPHEARFLLHQTIEFLISVDKIVLQNFILDLRQNATDLKFKHYRARCQYILIPPEDALTFWINHVLGHCPEGSRFAYFEGEILELLKILETVRIKEDQPFLSLHKEISVAFKIFKDNYPGFLAGLTREPLLIPVMDFSLQGEAVVGCPQHHCFALFASSTDMEHSLVTILQSLVHIFHYYLTEDFEVLPPGFDNLQGELSEESIALQALNAESFTETITASLLYDTEYMSLVAYMEFSHQQHEAIKQYLMWLQNMFFNGLGENVKKLIEEHHQKLHA
ncbi:hypothetical protein [Desulfitobacterium metallireducens]|uniref:Uncharacterized protein n=1 Tax=Desulfitobacterium metallireducens DSM 15288 TaxID=871968 RepID=W0EC78_9FIRM|nr:hypothetical protein [Desulfitobacterium metallireducens]AHF06804.1 hypothetical protein DESME_06815 [Desulfitobacterium metallireducens DSM 15288]